MLHLAAYAKTRNPKVITVAGGPAVRALPRFAARHFDHICLGDVEELRGVAITHWGEDVVTDPDDLFPRFDLRDLPRDWSPYSAFTFTAINPGPEPFFLLVRVDDIHHDNRPADRYLLRLTLKPGRHSIQIPLAAVATAPDTRPMDMTAIYQVIFYSYNLEEDRVMLFDDFRLESGTLPQGEAAGRS